MFIGVLIGKYLLSILSFFNEFEHANASVSIAFFIGDDLSNDDKK